MHTESLKHKIRNHNKREDFFKKIPNKALIQSIFKNSIEFILCWPSTAENGSYHLAFFVCHVTPLEKIHFFFASGFLWETVWVRDSGSSPHPPQCLDSFWLELCKPGARYHSGSPIVETAMLPWCPPSPLALKLFLPPLPHISLNPQGRNLMMTFI